MAQTLFYSSNAVQMSLAAPIASGDLTCNLSSTSGLPASFPFKLLLDWGSASQEVVYCTGLSGAVATIQRGKDTTTAQAHALGAVVVHGVSAEEYNNADLHRSLSSGVHGVTGSVVGTTDAQTLTNKTLTSPVITGGTITSSTISTATVSSPTVSGTTTETGVHSPDTAAHVGLTVKGLASQSGDLTQWQNSSGTVLSKADSTGALWSTTSHAGDLVTNPGAFLNVVSTVAATPVAVVRGAASQSADLQEWQDSTSAVLSKVASDGTIFAPVVKSSAGTFGNYSVAPGAVLNVVPSAPGNVPMAVRGAASQTANLQEWQDSAGTVHMAVTSAGRLSFPDNVFSTTAVAGTFTQPTQVGGYISAIVGTSTVKIPFYF